MGKYRNHEEFGGNAPMNWRERTTSQAYLEGMSGIAPPGMKPRVHRGKRFEENTDKPESTKWHHNYDIAMFGGTDIPLPTSQTKQATLEGMIVEGAIERIPQVKRG
jgi:hypothetical protein